MIAEHRMGWKPSHPDFRDKKYFAVRATPVPQSVDLSTSPFMPPIADQENLSSCTAFATCAALDYLNASQGKGFFDPSHLFEYYNTRDSECTASTDSGGTIRDAIKVTNQFGMCQELLWPYNISEFATRPSQPCYTQAATHEVSQYLSIDNTVLNDLLVCLADGYPIVFGATLYSSFENPGPDANGVIPMPDPSESVLGGHAQLIVGYDQTTKLFKVRNSWGTGWAIDGYEFIPFVYLTNPDLATDFWTLRALANAPQVKQQESWIKRFLTEL